VPPDLGLGDGIHKRKRKVEEFPDDPWDGEEDGSAETFWVEILEDRDELLGHAGRGGRGFLAGKVDDEDEVARVGVSISIRTGEELI
jgi:hypothetical protein